MRARTAILLVATLTACGPGEPAGPDGGPEADAGAAIDTTPAPPALTPCPAGWAEVERDGIARCEPSATAACEGTTFLLPGGDGCEPLDACGSDPFPAVTGTALHVAAGARAGDGTRERPFATIGEALAVATAGTTIAIGAGTYGESLVLPHAVELRGVCAERVVIRGAAGAPVVRVAASRTATIASLTIGGDDVGLYTEGSVTLRAVAIDGVRAAGIAAIGGGASIDAERVLVRGTRTDERGRLGRGIEIDHASVRLRDVVIAGSHDGGIATTGGELDLADVAVRDTLPNDAGRFGTAIAAFEGATATLERIAIERCSESGLLLDGVDATVRDVVIRDVASEASMANGNGVFVRAARITIERAWIERASRAGIAVYAGGELHASDVLVESTRASGVHGVGVGVASGTAALARIAIRDVLYAGVLASAEPGVPTTVTIEDLSVRGVAISADIAEGVLVANGASLEATRFAIAEGAVVGAQAFGAGTRLALRAGTISDIGEGETFAFGRGLELDVGARGELADVTIDGVRESGIVAYGEGTTASIERTRVRGIAERSCAATTCAGEAGGSGVVAVFGAAITASAIDVEGAPLCGVQVAEGASLDVESGEIRASAIGACVQVPGYDVARVVDGVAYRDNETNVDTGGAFVPPAGPPAPAAF